MFSNHREILFKKLEKHYCRSFVKDQSLCLSKTLYTESWEIISPSETVEFA